MAETLKTFFSPDLVRRLAGDIARVHPEFPARAFTRDACRGLDELELLDRGRHIARTLAAHLPQSYPGAIEILLRSLGPEHASDELLGGGMAPFFYLPHTIFVAERGLGHFELSMRAQYELTRRFSAEASIRPYLEHEPERTLSRLREWTSDPNPHVRRLVSEGTRLRLPWAPRVRWLERNPERVLELLELLKDDPSTLVRRSVANNLNDLGRARPDLLATTVAAWLRGASTERRALLRHATRGAVKRGDAKILGLLGYGRLAKVELRSVAFAPKRVRIGERVRVSFTLVSTAPRPQRLLVDLAVFFVKVRGHAVPKVFKVDELVLAAGARADLSATISLAVHTTRVPRPGEHAVAVLVNGRAVPAGSFRVVASKAAARR
jgi:3-methyladenine DNA glycosylase AlkC